jgi:mono/diheme cytochrome c family protein
VPCANCHGITGDGTGPAGLGVVPPPRNFTCAATMDALPDGQLYWVIENGSRLSHAAPPRDVLRVERPARGNPFSGMRSHKAHLSETEIWQLVLYIRSLARQG